MGCTPLESDLYASCMDILSAEMDVWGSGIYDIIEIEAEPTDTVEVYCDMDTAGGGWTVVWASMDGESAGVPWGDSTEDIGLAEVDDSGACALSGHSARSTHHHQTGLADWLGRPCSLWTPHSLTRTSTRPTAMRRRGRSRLDERTPRRIRRVV